jgi:hypothetical protein
LFSCARVYLAVTVAQKNIGHQAQDCQPEQALSSGRFLLILRHAASIFFTKRISFEEEPAVEPREKNVVITMPGYPRECN